MTMTMTHSEKLAPWQGLQIQTVVDRVEASRLEMNSMYKKSNTRLHRLLLC